MALPPDLSRLGPEAALSPLRRNITWALIILVCALNYIDRQAFGIFIPEIRKDLGISDQAMGLIVGLSFSIFYLIAAFPIARYADRGNRPLAIALCLSVWSLATAACALAGSGLQLALIRIGLAAGEGGATPASQSLLLDVLGEKRKTIVLASILAATSIGIGAGGWIGGMLSRAFDWRMSMVVIGLPGLVVAALVWLLAAEPRRAADQTFEPPPQMPLREVFGVLGGSASLRWIALTFVAMSIAGFPFVIWTAAFYQTVHGMTAHEAGNALFWPLTAGLVTGNLLAGWIGDRVGAGRPRRLASIAVIGPLAAFPFGIATAQLGSSTWSLAAFFAYQVLLTLHLAPLQALAFAQVPAAMRAMLGAAVVMVITLCGMGIGTWMVGALSTYFAERYGDESLRYALTSVCFSIPIGIATAIMAGRTAKLVGRTQP